MNDSDLYNLPIKEKKKLSRVKFIIMSLIGTFLIFIVMRMCLIPFMIFRHNFLFPKGFITGMCLIGCYFKTIQYIVLHDYAHGGQYEIYQVINASIYGMQGILYAMLFILLFNISAVSLYYIAIIIGVLWIIRKWWKI